MEESFYMPSLSRSRRVWMYLPESYHHSKKKYPVLYMHDGQNLFDESTSFSGEWGIDDILDTIPGACIVVGIENDGKFRMNEYNPNDNIQFGKGEGLEYLDFIVKVLKPYIDRNYRTLASAKHSLMAGSSMGGLISFYAGIYYPKVFGRLGIFSPAFWIAPEILEQIRKTVKPGKHGRQSYYFYGGGMENPRLIPDILQVTELLVTLSGARIEISLNPKGHHNEASWGEEFRRFYPWIIAE